LFVNSHNFTIFLHDRGSVLPKWRCDTLCTSGYVDDAIFSHNGLIYTIWIEYDKRNSRGSDQIFRDDKDQQVVLIVSCTPGPKSVLIHDLLFLPISTIVSIELTTRNPLSHSRLACSRLSGHIQPSVNRRECEQTTYGWPANLLNTTTQHLNYNGHELS